ncbi:MAG: hypothetical protein ABUK01_02030 [Leptospirales bacterium]
MNKISALVLFLSSLSLGTLVTSEIIAKEIAVVEFGQNVESVRLAAKNKSNGKLHERTDDKERKEIREFTIAWYQALFEKKCSYGQKLLAKKTLDGEDITSEYKKEWCNVITKFNRGNYSANVFFETYYIDIYSIDQFDDVIDGKKKKRPLNPYLNELEHKPAAGEYFIWVTRTKRGKRKLDLWEDLMYIYIVRENGKLRATFFM